MPNLTTFQHFLASRRRLLNAAAGMLLVLTIAGCDQAMDEFENYDGPEIAELDFATFNSTYIAVGIDQKTQFPHSSIINGTPSGKTDPVSIAYYLQFLIDDGDAARVETLIDHLLIAQEESVQFLNYRGLIPNLTFAATTTGFSKETADVVIQDNAALSARVAMAAAAFTGTGIDTKCLQFLDAQKEGYNYYLSDGSLFYPTMGNAITSEIGDEKIDLLFSDHYAEMAFVMSYFIGDTEFITDAEVGIDAFNALTVPENVPTDVHGDSFTGLINLTVPLAQNGSASQYFQSLLVLDPVKMNSTVQGALYNTLHSFLDAARFDNLPGIYSAAPDQAGAFQTDNGLNRLAAKRQRQTAKETYLAIDALGPAMRLFPDDERNRQTLRRWIGLYDAVPGTRSNTGHFGSVNKQGSVSPALYARQNLAMILFNTTGPGHLDAFLTSEGRSTLTDLFSRLTITHNGGPIERVSAPLPLPPPQAQLFGGTPDEAPDM